MLTEVIGWVAWASMCMHVMSTYTTWGQVGIAHSGISVYRLQCSLEAGVIYVYACGPFVIRGIGTTLEGRY